MAKLVFSANTIVVTTIPLALTVALNCFILVFSVQRLVAGRLYYYRLNPLRKLALAVSIWASNSPASTANLIEVNAFTSSSPLATSTLGLPFASSIVQLPYFTDRQTLPCSD